MKQISTGTGLVALAVGMVATAFIATHRGGNEAFAQVTGGDRRIVAQGVYGLAGHWGYRVWSDNITEVRWLGASTTVNGCLQINTQTCSAWQIVDSGTPSFVPTDLDQTGQVDAADIAQVLLDFNSTNDPTTPPPIDCNINAPR